MPTSFANNIRTLFREKPDIEAMKRVGLDLSSYDDVKANASAIYSRLENGTMPCDGAWPKERVEVFKRWMDEGLAP